MKKNWIFISNIGDLERIFEWKVICCRSPNREKTMVGIHSKWM